MCKSIEEPMEEPKYPNPEIYVFNSAGCHGHYLVYLIDRLSKKTPVIEELPFNSLGNSHKEINYSGFVKFVDEYQHDDYKDLKNKKIIKITYSNEILYYERVAMNRSGDSNIDLENMNKDISFLKKYNESFYKKIYKLYSIDTDDIPKWMLRDVYKLGFLDWENQGSVISLKNSMDFFNKNLNTFNEVYFLNVNIFFNIETLKNELKKLDILFNLELQFNELEIIHKEFLNLNKILQTKNNTNIVLEAIEKNKNIDIPSLDIIQQAFIYAELEKKYNFILRVMCYFFSMCSMWIRSTQLGCLVV